jgi:hypothetical protein
MYFTDWTLHLWLLPRGAEQLGHGKEVLSLSTSGVPEDAQTVALPLAPAIDLLPYKGPFLALIVQFLLRPIVELAKLC